MLPRSAGSLRGIVALALGVRLSGWGEVRSVSTARQPILYMLVPWIGVMAAGYGFGAIVMREPADVAGSACGSDCRRQRSSSSAAGLVVFVRSATRGCEAGALPLPESAEISRVAAVPADDARADDRPAAAGRARARVARGRVRRPSAACRCSTTCCTFPRFTSPRFSWRWFASVRSTRNGTASAPFTSVPPDHRWSLWLLYVVFALVVAALYPVCRWFDRVKAQRESGWIRYILVRPFTAFGVA